MNADEWNRLYPVGTAVIAYPGVRPERATAGWDCPRLDTTTRTTAWLLGGDAVVMVNGHASCISLDHVDPAPDGAA